jgi:anaerobic sulfite reductase subunit C
MTRQEIDYDALKKRGFLQSKHEGEFTLRTRMPAGNYGSNHLSKLSEIAKKYGRDMVHLTVRQGIEVPYIPYDKIDEVVKEISRAGILPGTSGPRLRATTSCPGNNWCKRGLVDTFSLFNKIEKRGIVCAMDLPHKFKIVITGCPNACTRAQSSEIGVHGAVDLTHPEKRIGYAVYIGGCGGKTPRMGVKLDKVYAEEEVLALIEKVVGFYKKNAKPRQRLALLIEEIGKEKLLKTIDVYDE